MVNKRVKNSIIAALIIIALIAISILIIKAKSPKYEEEIADDPIIIEEEPEIEETPVEEEAEPETPVIEEQPKVEETPIETPTEVEKTPTIVEDTPTKVNETPTKVEQKQETVKPKYVEPEPIIVEEPTETVSEEVIDEIVDETVDETEEPVDEPIIEATEALYTASQFKRLGVIKWNGWRWTWYSERVLPGGGLTILGRHNDENGYICDENDYICVASSVLSKGTVVDTPFGKQGKVYDCGCDADVLDVYVGW